MRSWGQEEKEADRMKQPQLGKEQMLARREGEREKGGDGRLGFRQCQKCRSSWKGIHILGTGGKCLH